MNKIKVLLINPPNSVPQTSDFTVNIYQPIGLAYIAANLKKYHIPVKIIDALALGHNQIHNYSNRKLFGLSYQQIKTKIKSYQPQIVGISTPFSFQSFESHQIAKIVKQIDRNILVIAGGAHATINPNEILSDHNFDYLVRGEGEEIMVQIVNLFHHPQKIHRLANLSYRQKNKIIHNPRSLPIANLDSLPFPARNLLPMEHYHQAAKTGRVIEGLLSFGQKRTSLFTSRGCPFHCTFCSVHLTMTRMWRPRSPENVLAEIIDCVNNHQIKYFDILDDNFTLDPNRAKKICRLIIDAKLKITWSTPNGIRADRVDEELIILMKQAGCIQLKVAPESGSPLILKKVIKKQLNLRSVEKVVSLCHRHQLSIEAFFIIGFPEEKIKDIKQTIKFAKKLRQLGCDFCYFFLATPYPGTEMYQNAIDHHYLNLADYDLNQIITTGSSTILSSPNYTKDQLLALQKKASSINPPVTKIRLVSGIKMLLIDPKRIFHYGFNYLRNYFTPLFN